MEDDFGLDQIPSSFTGNPLFVTGPGVWLGEMSILGVVPSVVVLSTDSSYSF